MAIRYDNKLNQEINKTIRNFNQKIARLEKTERDLIIPQKITKKELKQSYYNRSDLRRKLQELQRYSERGIEKTITTQGGVELSKYEYVNLKKEAMRVKQQLTREIHKLEKTSPKVFGKKQDTTYAQTGDQYYLNLKARRKALDKGKLKNLSKEQYNQYKSLVTRTAKNKQYYNNVFKDNYLQMLTDLGYYYGYDKVKLAQLKENLMELDSASFLKLFREEKSIQAILDYYPTIISSFGNKRGMRINPSDLKEDVSSLYDALIDNLDDITKDVK